MGPKFFETRMGQKFYDGTMPRLANAAEKLVESATRLVAALEVAPPWSMVVPPFTAEDCELVAAGLEAIAVGDDRDRARALAVRFREQARQRREAGGR